MVRRAARIVHTYHFPLYGGVTSIIAASMETDEKLERAACQVAEEAATWARSEHGVQASAKVQLVDAARVLIDESKDAAMVVVGCRGHAALSSSVLGSVSRDLTHRAHRPVVVVRRPVKQAMRTIDTPPPDTPFLPGPWPSRPPPSDCIPLAMTVVRVVPA